MPHREALGNLLFVFRQVQQAEDLIAGSHAVHGDVEKAAQLPHGEEKVCRQQDNQQTAGQRDMVIYILRHRHNHPQRRPAVGNQIHNRDGVELHGQHLHGDFAKLLGFHIHLFVFEFVRLVDFEGG